MLIFTCKRVKKWKNCSNWFTTAFHNHFEPAYFFEVVLRPDCLFLINIINYYYNDFSNFAYVPKRVVFFKSCGDFVTRKNLTRPNTEGRPKVWETLIHSSCKLKCALKIVIPINVLPTVAKLLYNINSNNLIFRN